MTDDIPHIHDGQHRGLPFPYEMVEVSTDQIQYGPVRHDTLPPELLARIKPINDWQNQFLFRKVTLEEFELGFMRDRRPDLEVCLWERMMDVHQRYMEAHSGTDAKELFRCIINLSIGMKPKAGDWLYRSVSKFAGDSIVKPILLAKKETQ